MLDLLVELRTRLRKEKNFALADEIRNRLADLGVTLEDRPDGTALAHRAAKRCSRHSRSRRRSSRMAMIASEREPSRGSVPLPSGSWGSTRA